MEILRTKSQSAAVVIGISKFFDEKENRDVIVTASDFKRNNAFIFKDSGNYFLGLENIFRNSLDELKDILILAGGSISKSKITQAGLSHMITFLEKLCLSDDAGVNKALIFIVFQIHDSSQRRGGVCTLFDVLYNYLVQRKLNQESEFLSYGTYKEKKYIYINGKTVTYVCKNADALTIKELANSKSHMTYADTIGSFRKNASGMDAVTFLTVKMDTMHTASIFGKTYNIGQLYYRQLNVEVNTLKKVLANIDDHSRVKMHGNSRDGFVKRLDDAGKSRATGLIRALDHSNSIRFKSIGMGRDEKLSYVVDSCFIRKMQNGRGLCVTIDNINKLIEHKLVHDCGIGRTCSCGAKACDDESLLDQLAERGHDVVANAKEAMSAMCDDEEHAEKIAVTKSDAKLDDRIVQGKGSRYMSASVYRSRLNTESTTTNNAQSPVSDPVNASANVKTSPAGTHTDESVMKKEDHGVIVNESTTFKINSDVVFDAAEATFADTSSGLSSLLKTKMKF
ncbi:VP5 [Banna virus strain JKT-6423]|uniref:Non-structural protein 1 n=1 Tax=Banna virus TaxID=77763 RepID=NS1_BANNV|nr:VP5 [Banna virus strain JKT-6423]Q9INI2.1 RecName: Full=Non-structural protein 1; Short=NS1 [Banna virus strain JKT-6423]AAF78858.1 VP5 [Banna virus]